MKLDRAMRELKRTIERALHMEGAELTVIDEPVPAKPRQVIHNSEAGEEHSGYLQTCPKCSIGGDAQEFQFDMWPILLDLDREPRALER